MFYIEFFIFIIFVLLLFLFCYSNNFYNRNLRLLCFLAFRTRLIITIIYIRTIMDIKIAVKSHILITIHCLGLGAGVDLLGLINDVLDMSKIESGKMKLNLEQLSLREILNGISTIVHPQLKMKKQHFDIYISDIITENVYCDSVRLNQVLLNLDRKSVV